MNANTPQRFRDLFFSFGRTVRTGSVTEYYDDVSGGKISMTGEVIGPYRMPKQLSEYGNGKSGMGGVAPNIQTLGADALAAARGHINFAPYDNDGNGMVDAFVVVHAGTGAETTGDLNGIWSCKWVLPTQESVDGVNIFAFLTIPEDAECGVCAHELGHLVFGWPDLYDIDRPGDPGDIGVISEGIGNWCLMAGGSWGRVGDDPAGTTPCHPSAWCKATQGWITLVNEATNVVNNSLSLPDVKTGQHEVHRLWTNGDMNSKEYFLIENRQTTGFDESLPGAGLLGMPNWPTGIVHIAVYANIFAVWHVDDAVADNRNENHPKVGLMQADGLNQLALSNAGRGDDGDPFPGRSNNMSFNFTSNPSSKTYTGADSMIEINSISISATTMTMNLTVSPLTAVYAQGVQGEPGNGIGGYDLRSTADLAFSFDGASSGRRDHLVLYRPGTGGCWILQNNNGVFAPIYARGERENGIGGYDLRSSADLGLAFDYSSNGQANHLVFYRPGQGAIFIIARQGSDYVAVYAQGAGGAGIGGYNLRSPNDRIFAFDYDHSGKLDHLCLYRPGTGTFWILRHSGGSFTPVYAQGDPGNGIGGFNLGSQDDRAFAFDYEGSGKQDYIVLYRPGTGTFWCLKNTGGSFSAVINIGAPGAGIGGYNLSSPQDRLFAFDWEGSGKQDHIVCYRPGSGTFWCLQKRKDGGSAGGGFDPVYTQGAPGNGIGGYDLKSVADEVFAMDWSHDGKTDALVLYRRNATGTIWILKHP